MQTIKTGVVVALLLAVCYGAFVALNAPEPNLPDELLSEFDWSPEEAGLDNLTSVEMPSSPSAAFQASASTEQNAPGGLGSFDASSFGLPTLPTSNGIANTSGGSNSTSGVGQFSGDNRNSNLANSGLPSLPSFAGTANAQANSFGQSNSMNLPTLPNAGGNTPSGNSSVAAADGPAVSLAAGLSSDLASTYAMGASNVPQPDPNGTMPPGQLVSQTRPSNSDAGPVGQLPLLDGISKSSVTPADANQEQPTLPFSNAREQALELASSGKLRDALQILSRYYDSPDLTSTQHDDLIDLLDSLSREVIYSPRHLASTPYTVAANETVEGVALSYQVTPELLTAINGLWNSKTLTPGSQIKVLPGPFRAVVSLSRNELTVFLGDLYAGRFPVSFGTDPSPVEGTFEVIDRRLDRTYYGTGGKIIAAEDNRNPYGGFWLNLGQDLCIHGTPEMASDDLRDAGCISLAPLDAADVYNILAQSSQVSIVR